MRALVYDPDAPQGLRLGDAPDPQPEASQVVVKLAGCIDGSEGRGWPLNVCFE